MTATELTEDLTVWQGLLRGERPEIEKNVPYCGIYRGRLKGQETDSPVRIYVEDGEVVVWDGRRKVGSRTCLADAAWAEDNMGWLLKRPITAEAYEHWIEHGSFPDEVTTPEVPRSHADRPNAAPHELIQERIAELKQEADAWLVSIGGVVKNKEHADKAANYADAFAELAKEAEAARVAEKEPHLTASREVDSTWKPVTTAGEQWKRWAKGLCEAYLKAERQRLAAEVAARAAAGEAVRPEDLKVKSGTRGRAVSLRTVKELTYSDFAQVRAHYRDDDRIWKHPDVLRVVGQIATTDLNADKPVPGAAFVEKQVAA